MGLVRVEKQRVRAYYRSRGSELTIDSHLTFQRATNLASISSGSDTKALRTSANLPEPDIIAAEIVEDVQSALAQFATIAADLKR